MLSPAISFCDAGGRHVFLDLVRDRYFCLTADVDQSFKRLVTKQALSYDDHVHLDGLRARRILIPADHGSSPRACVAPKVTKRALLDEVLPMVSRAQILRAGAALAKARFDLRWRTLHGLLSNLATVKLRTSCAGEVDLRCLTEIASAFHGLESVIAPLDQCLSLSLATARRALARNMMVTLVLGIKLRPFQAHAWVQAGNVLVSDRLAAITPFTPILVI